jgi:diguanylate cyclase (GGDEF)-like protein
MERIMSDMSLVGVLQAEIGILFGIILIIVASVTLPPREARNPEDRLFIAISAIVTALLFIDSISCMFDGKPGPFFRTLLWTTNTVYFILHMLPPLLFILYAQYHLGANERSIRFHERASTGIMVLWTAICLSGPKTGLIFTITEANVYIRGTGYKYAAIILFLVMAYAFLYVITHRGDLPGRQWYSLLFYALPSTIGASLQNLFYGTILVWPLTVIAILVLALNLQSKKIITDPLTGLQNRVSLMRYLRSKARNRESGGLSGIALDLDGFKSINDRLGHAMGDRALEEAAAIIRESIRSNDFLARIGGDEFIILLETESTELIRLVVERIERNFTLHRKSERRPYVLATSIGWGVYDHVKDRSLEGFLARLDEELYKDKKRRLDVQ